MAVILWASREAAHLRRALLGMRLCQGEGASEHQRRAERRESSRATA